MDKKSKIFHSVITSIDKAKKFSKTQTDYAFFIISICHTHGISIPRDAIGLIAHWWGAYYRRADIIISPNLFVKKDQILQYHNMNEAFRVSIYDSDEINRNFSNPILDHSLYTERSIGSGLGPGVKDQKDLFRAISLIEFYENEYNTSQIELAFFALSIYFNNMLPVPPSTIKIIVNGWLRYCQRSDLAVTNVSNSKRRVKPFRNLNEAFDIPIYTKGRIRKEFFSELVYMSLASLKAQGAIVDNLTHDFIGNRYGLTGATCRNYYNYLLRKGAPSVSGRLKISNKRSGLEIPFTESLENFAALQKFRREESRRVKIK